MNKAFLFTALATACLASGAFAKSKPVTSRPRGVDYPLPAPPSSVAPAPDEADTSSSTGKPNVVIVEPYPEKAAKKGRKGAYSAVKVLDFESREERNEYDGGYFGVWSKDPDDITQGCNMSFSSPGAGSSDTCLQLDYDVDAFHDAYNGFWLLFVDIDLRAYSNICFWVRGDASAGYTSRFIVELKNEDQSSQTIVDGLTDKWQLIRLPFAEFYGITDWSKMTEFVIVFKDTIVSKKQGTVFIDSLFFDAGKPDGTLDMADPRMTHEEAEKASTTTTSDGVRRQSAPGVKPLYEKTGGSVEP